MNKGTASVLSLRNALNIPPGAEDAGNSLATLLDILPTEIIEDFRMSDLNCLIFTTNVGKDFLSTLSLYHVSSYPKILIIDTGHTGTVCKYTIPLSFENNEGISYKLIGLGIYTGGHYYALCKTLDKWVKYNDSSYSLIKSPEIPSGSIPKIIVFEKC
jgi:hypothetical protein